MQLIYVHGLNSDSNALKGKMLQDWCALHRPEIVVKRPDLNMSPQKAVDLLGNLIKQDPNTALVGSSLGGFYTTACVAQYGVKAVLLNPSVRPFDSMHKYFSNGEASFTTETGWVVTPDQFDELKAMYHAVPVQPQNMLVILKQGDEVLDYRIAEQHYSQDGAQSTLLIETGGDHLMLDMVDKIPMMIDFLFATP